jgi:RNA polymerase sigma factor (sigma-70 family)
MEDALSIATEPDGPAADQNRRISEVILRERRRLLNFIRRRVDDEGDAEDILQDVFYELTQAYRSEALRSDALRMMQPIEQVGAWLYRVARNRIIDRFRKKRPETSDPASEELLPSPDAGPESLYARTELFEEFATALEELSEEQRDVFIAHEMDGRSFKDLAAETGLSVNTLLSRKRYAVLHLRRRLQAIYEDFMEL